MTGKQKKSFMPSRLYAPNIARMLHRVSGGSCADGSAAVRPELPVQSVYVPGRELRAVARRLRPDRNLTKGLETMNFRKEIEEIARATFAEVERIENEYKSAELRRKETPQRMGIVNADYAAKAARAEADYLAARDALNNMKRDLPGKARTRIAEIRRLYVQEVAQRFAVDPSKMDMAALELLKSGIMRPAEYSGLMQTAQKSGNVTMSRLIARYASEAAEAAGRKYGEGSPQARELRAVGYSGNIDPGAAALETFDGIAEIFNRCIGNPSMIDHWDELAGPLLDML